MMRDIVSSPKILKKVRSTGLLQEHECQVDTGINSYTLGKLLGRGQFGEVRKAIHKLSGEEVAIKIYNKRQLTSKSHQKAAAKEIHILKKIRHPNILHFYEAVKTNKEILLAMELCSGKSLTSMLKKCSKFSEPVARQIFLQLAEAITYLHGRNIIHRDIKPDNVIIVKNEGYHFLKLIDFGFSTISLPNESKLKTFCGTPAFIAPEIVKGAEYNGRPVDVWSLGILLYIMIAGRPPFEATSSQLLYKKIAHGHFEYPKSISGNLKDLLSQMLQLNPEKRCRADEVCRHIWLRDCNNITYTQSDKSSLFVAEKLIDDEIILQLENSGLNKGIIHDDISYERFNSATTSYRLLHVKKLKELKSNQLVVNSECCYSSTYEPPSSRSRTNSSPTFSLETFQQQGFASFLKERIAKAKMIVE